MEEVGRGGKSIWNKRSLYAIGEAWKGRGKVHSKTFIIT